MGHAIGFWCAFAATVLLLVVSLVAGLRRRRRLHLVTGPLTLAMLAVTVAATKDLIANYSFPPDDLRFHLRFAITAGASALPVAATGIWLWRQPRARRWHRLAVWTFVVLTVVATCTGIWLFGRATLKG